MRYSNNYDPDPTCRRFFIIFLSDELGNYFLRNKHFTTNGAVLALCLTSRIIGRLNSGIDNYGMSKCGCSFKNERVNGYG